MKKVAHLTQETRSVSAGMGFAGDPGVRTPDLPEVVRTLWNAPISRLKARVASYGPINPVGDGDIKTASPSTYRPIGPTCPNGANPHLPRCPYLGDGCYGEGGNVNIHQGRASDLVGPSVLSAAVGMIWAVRVGKMCRLHVSGDFVAHDRIDHRYIAQLGILCDTVRHVATKAGAEVGQTLAWSYTHIPPLTFAPYKRYLGRKGIHVRLSDHIGADGCIVCDFDTLDTVKAHLPRKCVKCPAQLSHSLTCDQCRICWERPEYIVVFNPHGATKRRARTASLRILQQPTTEER